MTPEAAHILAAAINNLAGQLYLGLSAVSSALTVAAVIRAVFNK